MESSINLLLKLSYFLYFIEIQAFPRKRRSNAFKQKKFGD